MGSFWGGAGGDGGGGGKIAPTPDLSKTRYKHSRDLKFGP